MIVGLCGLTTMFASLRAKQQFGKDAYEQLQCPSLTAQSRDHQMWEAVTTA